MLNNKRGRSQPRPFYLFLVQHTKHPVTHPLNSLFNVIKFPAQFLYFVVIRKQDQTTFRDLHGNARADLKSRFSQPFGADFEHWRVMQWASSWQRRQQIAVRNMSMMRQTCYWKSAADGRMPGKRTHRRLSASVTTDWDSC